MFGKLSLTVLALTFATGTLFAESSVENRAAWPIQVKMLLFTASDCSSCGVTLQKIHENLKLLGEKSKLVETQVYLEAGPSATVPSWTAANQYGADLGLTGFQMLPDDNQSTYHEFFENAVTVPAAVLLKLDADGFIELDGTYLYPAGTPELTNSAKLISDIQDIMN